MSKFQIDNLQINEMPSKSKKRYILLNAQKQGNVEMLLELIATKAVDVGLCNGVSNTSSGELVPQKKKVNAVCPGKHFVLRYFAHHSKEISFYAPVKDLTVTQVNPSRSNSKNPHASLVSAEDREGPRWIGQYLVQ